MRFSSSRAASAAPPGRMRAVGFASAHVLEAATLPILALSLWAVALADGAARPVLWLASTAVFCALLALRLAADCSFPAAPAHMALPPGLRILIAIGAAFLAGLGLQLVPLPPPLAALAPLPLELPATARPVSLTPSATALGILRGAGALALFCLVAQLACCPRAARRLAWLIVLGVAGHALLALAALQMPGEGALWSANSAYPGFATGGFVNRNAFAAHMGLGMNLALALALADARRRPPEALLLVSLAGAMLAALAASGSRMGLVSSLVGAGVVLFFARPRRSLARRRGAQHPLRVALPGVLALGLVAFLAGRALPDRLLATPAALEERLLLWRQSLRLISERPWTGFGWDGFAAAFELYHRPELSPARVWDFPHATYLTLWCEAGLIWGSLPLLAGLLAGARLVAGLGGAAAPANPMAVAALAALVQAALHAAADFSFEIDANLLLLLALIALGLGRAEARRCGALARKECDDG